MRLSTNREQGQASLNFAERENVRPMVQQAKLWIITLLLMVVAPGAWADEVTTQYANGVFTGFTATDGSGGTGNEGYAKLVDGNTGTKLCCTHGNPTYVEFHSSFYFVPTGYIMTTVGDASQYSNRNPKSWVIKAKVNENDAEWTTLATETDNTTVGGVDTHPYEFTITGITTAYKYFRLEVTATQGATLLHLAEFQFKGTPTDLCFSAVSGVKSFYGIAENPSITPVVSLGSNNLTFGTDYTATLNGDNVESFPINITQKGDYTLTLTGNGSYTGTKSISICVHDELNGGGTQQSPYTIGSTDDWNLFVTNVTKGDSYSGKFVKLTADISISTLVGSSESIISFTNCI